MKITNENIPYQNSIKLKKLPIGLSTLKKIREEGYLYIDKTHHVANMVNSGVYYFLSRPRRFGKSLFVDTLKQAFLGNKEIFEGLYLENNWDWSAKYPVIHISFGGSSGFDSQTRLNNIIGNRISEHAKFYDVDIDLSDSGEAFSQLIKALAEKFSQNVVILIDEYDKPILDVINSPDEAAINREILKGLYSVIKDNDNYLKLVLLTGVSKFSKVSLFSGLNNLEDITLDKRYADICGYTQDELDREFKEYLVDVDKDKLKLWYNGYNFAGSDKQRVYNPFDILLFLSKGKEYRSYWFETATPAFLVKLMEARHYFVPELEGVVVTEEDLSSFDVDNINFTTLLLQTGYLTIKEIMTIGSQYGYVLSYPNLEVKSSLNNSLACIGSSSESKSRNLVLLDTKLKQNDIAGLENVFRSYFASIPNDWYRRNDMANYEGFYASIVYSYFCALGYDLIAEDVTNHGKIDLTIRMPDKILILEFKLNSTALEAINQIKNRGYKEKYLSDNKPIYLVGVSFDSETRNINDFIVEKY